MAASPVATNDWEIVERTSDHADEHLKLDIETHNSHADSEESSRKYSETEDTKDSSSNFRIQPSKEDALPDIEAKKEESSVIRKTATAVAGGAMVGVGLIMIPLPTPFGAVVAGGGMAVLGTEFPAAQRALDKTCSAVADAIEKSVSKDDDEELDCEDGKKNNTSGEYANEKMKKILEERNKSKDTTFDIKKNVKQLGKKAVPVIRRIGEGIDKETLHGATESISKASKDTRDTVSSFAQTTQTKLSKGASHFWRSVMILDDDEDLMAPFKRTPKSPER